MKMNIDHLKTSEKLNTLADYLPKVRPNRFDMTKWGTGREPPTWEALTSSALYYCGTAACALGVAACLFEGLKFIKGRLTYAVVQENVENQILDPDVSYRAGASFFGITVKDSEFIFLPKAQDSLNTVISRIRSVAESYAARGR